MAAYHQCIVDAFSAVVTLLALNGVTVLVLGIVPGPLMTVCLQAISHTLPR